MACKVRKEKNPSRSQASEKSLVPIETTASVEDLTVRVVIGPDVHPFQLFASGLEFVAGWSDPQGHGWVCIYSRNVSIRQKVIKIDGARPPCLQFRSDGVLLPLLDAGARNVTISPI